MKKIINKPENYTDDMLKGIYNIHKNEVGYANNDLRCYRTLHKQENKVAIVTGGGTGHLPLFLGYVGDGMLDGCAVGSVFQSPSAEQIYELTKAVDNGAGVLYLYGNYTGDIMNFDMASELCEMDGIEVKTIVGADDVNSATKNNADKRRGVAGIFFMYKAAGAKAMMNGNLEEVLAAAKKAKDNTRTVGFALTPCIIPEIGKPNFNLGENEMAMGMGIHGEPGIWTGPIKTADEVIKESINTLLGDITVNEGEEVSLIINGLGATSQEELYILGESLYRQLNEKGIKIYRTFVGEFATSMEMAGASISLMKMDSELKEYIDMPVNTPFYKQK
ncbi:dihydroxyacetone kinase subunit DhaK [Clostridium saudiense]|uniref:dihydroxyacetone kinase subunit DhaK n=1 Tax=Clostridium saudiense TaxID=1414720 RepID=UPI000823038A|nr:dihydroxyacetone kinase subunit DhaK [Clostridium saudiense]MDU7453704.1 dihydroxyacetone kinase subunit DhaK [Clostridium saudiense]SCJ87048.1 PTS-dependent dihydroxyacetone kinase%2C dihydroxyacetone-binding subunit dhaK [uncultured Clostridium sp.]